jgi:hypothetical protein
VSAPSDDRPGFIGGAIGGYDDAAPPNADQTRRNMHLDIGNAHELDMQGSGWLTVRWSPVEDAGA